MIETEKKEERVLLIGVELQQNPFFFFLRINHLKTPLSGLKCDLLHQLLQSDKR